MSNYYKTLGVERNASPEEIKRAYRAGAKEFHPDVNPAPEAAAKFKEISEAYQVLSDPDKRAHFDRFGEAPASQGGFGSGYQHIDLNEALNIFMRDLGGMGGFESLFGGGHQSAAERNRGSDVRVTAKLSMAEVAVGVKRTIKIKTQVPCTHCHATGAAKGARPVTCGTCNGNGEVRRAARSMFGQFVQVGPCPACHGEGTVVRTPCEVCRGEGRVKGEKTVTVDVPPGVSSQNYLTSRGDGAAGLRGGASGDLQVMIEVTEDERWKRHGDDLVHDLAISFSQAALGTTASIPTPLAEERLSVPAGIQSGTLLRLKGKGLPRLGANSVGDLHVRVHVWTPDELNDEQKKLFAEIARHEGEGPSKKKDFWSKLKHALGA